MLSCYLFMLTCEIILYSRHATSESGNDRSLYESWDIGLFVVNIRSIYVIMSCEKCDSLPDFV